MLTLRLAFRSLWRHKLRTIITLSAVALGHFMLLVFVALGDGMHERMIDLGIRQNAGHVVIQANGFQKQQSIELLVTNPKAIEAAIKRRFPQAKIAVRAYGGGLVKSSSNASGVLFVGVRPKRERRVADLPKRMVRGVYLGAPAAEIARAAKKVKPPPGTRAKADPLWCARQKPRADGRGGQIVIGTQMAKALKVKLCDKIVVSARGLAEQESQQFRVVGVFRTGNPDLDAHLAHLGLGDVQHLLHIGQSVHQVAVFIGDARRSASTQRALKKLALLGGPELEVLRWDQAMPQLAEYVAIDDAGNYIFLGVIFLIIAIGVLNTVLMSVMERTREFGLLRALGSSHWRVGGLVLAESALIGCIGVAIGLGLAMPLNYYLSTTGIDLTTMMEVESFSSAGVTISGVIRSKIYLGSVIWGSLAVIAMTMVSAIYPAIRAMTMKLLKAVHHA